MVATIHYRWDFIGLSTQEKPTPETSDKVVDGSTFYSSDDSKLYVWYKDQWYERKALGGGGGGSTINVVQTTGESTTDVMSQKAVTDALAEAGGSGVTELTSADYNWPESNPDGIAVWLLEDGDYRWSVSLKTYETTSRSRTWTSPSILNIMAQGTYALHFNANDSYWYKVYMTSDGSTFIENKFITDDTLVQTTGTSTTTVMSQNATTSMVYADPSTKQRIKIGNSATTNSQYNISIGEQANTLGNSAIAIGNSARSRMQGSVCIGVGSSIENNSSAEWSVALGASSNATRAGEVNIGAGSSGHGYNSTNYRVLGGVHDPADAHDAATKGYVDTLIATLEARIAALEGN